MAGQEASGKQTRAVGLSLQDLVIGVTSWLFPGTPPYPKTNMDTLIL